LLITFTSSIILFGGFSTVRDPIESNIIIDVTGSNTRPSFNANPFLSGLGNIHLLFQHIYQNLDMVSRHYYHTYKLTNGNWAQPVKVFDFEYKILAIHPNENGFAIYYNNNGLSKKEYDEQNHSWLDPVLLFGTPHLQSYLDSSGEELDLFVHSTCVFENGSFLLAWSFRSQGGSLLEKEGLYIVSHGNPNGSINSQPIYGLIANKTDVLTFVPFNDSVFLYSEEYMYRTILLHNRTWTNWQTTGLIEIYNTSGLSMSVTDRYSMWWTHRRENYTGVWVLLDLAGDFLTINEINIPYNPKIEFSHYGFRYNLSSSPNISFLMSIVINGSLELWKLDYLNNNWSLMTSKYYNITHTYETSYYKTVLLQEDTNWNLFWSNMATSGVWEIFSASYDTSTKEWSSLTQITDTTTITDDYKSYFSPAFSSLAGIIGLLIVTLLTLGNRKKSQRMFIIVKKK
jgi:hypothetical protein